MDRETEKPMLTPWILLTRLSDKTETVNLAAVTSIYSSSETTR